VRVGRYKSSRGGKDDDLDLDLSPRRGPLLLSRDLGRGARVSNEDECCFDEGLFSGLIESLLDIASAGGDDLRALNIATSVLCRCLTLPCSGLHWSILSR